MFLTEVSLLAISYTGTKVEELKNFSSAQLLKDSIVIIQTSLIVFFILHFCLTCQLGCIRSEGKNTICSESRRHIFIIEFSEPTELNSTIYLRHGLKINFHEKLFTFSCTLRKVQTEIRPAFLKFL